MAPESVELFVVNFHENVEEEEEKDAQLYSDKGIAGPHMAKEGRIHEQVGQEQKEASPYVMGLHMVDGLEER